MKILSHRGYWKNPDEKNQPIAFHRSFDLGYGTETDFRDFKEIVISHDIPKGNEISADSFFSILGSRKLPLAINIKADGLASALKILLEKHKIENYFVFDMSIPDMLQYINLGFPVFTRVSEYEPEPACFNESAGIWLDAFKEIWYTTEMVKSYLAKKPLCLVSPELHKREPMTLWKKIKEAGLHHETNLLLCTDLPEMANEFFQ